MARVYLQTNGRTDPKVKRGIIFETDGAPNYKNTGDPQNYTCAAARAAADRAKNANPPDRGLHDRLRCRQ